MNDEDLAKMQKLLHGIGEKYREQMEALGQGVAKLSQQFQTQVDSLTAESSSVKPFLEKLANIDWPKFHDKMSQSTERLANLGWTLPMSFTPGDLIDLAETTNTDQQVEQYLVDFFTSDNRHWFKHLQNEVLTSKNLVGWRVLLGECFEAYDRGHYLVPIPALLSIVEGSVAGAAGRLNSGKVEPNKFAAELEKAASPGSMQFLVWRSVRTVLDNLCASSHFGGSQPAKLNRHWVLHGRDQTQWTQTDTLRLFNLLQTIC